MKRNYANLWLAADTLDSRYLAVSNKTFDNGILQICSTGSTACSRDEKLTSLAP